MHEKLQFGHECVSSHSSPQNEYYKYDIDLEGKDKDLSRDISSWCGNIYANLF
jgi:hypothetical protein